MDTRYSDGVALFRTILEQTAAAHHEYEKSLSAPDDDWAAWYATYIAENFPMTLESAAVSIATGVSW